MSEKNNNKKKLVEKEWTEACGCHKVAFSDGTGEVSPCLSCGLDSAGEALYNAAIALRAVALRLQRSRQQVMMSGAIQKALKEKGK